MGLLLVLGEQYYSFIILLFVGSRHKFSHNFRYPQTSVTNSIIVVPLEISSQLWHVLPLDCHGILAITGLLGSFGLLSLFAFPFFVRVPYLSIRNVRLLLETSSFAYHSAFQIVICDL